MAPPGAVVNRGGWRVLRVPILTVLIGALLAPIAPPATAANGPDTGFAQILERERQALGAGDRDLSHPAMRAQVDAVDAVDAPLLAAMNREPSRTAIFDAWPNMADRGHVNETYKALRIIASAYVTEGSRYEGDPEVAAALVDALEWLYVNAYNENSTLIRQWPTMIGIPTALADVIIALGPEVSHDQAARWLRGSKKYTPDPYVFWGRGETTGANRVWEAQVVLLRGAILGDAQEVATASDSLDPVFEYVDAGDGFHRDGTIIQHDHYPYNGGYGLALYELLPHVVWLLDGTPWTVDAPGLANMYDWADLSYAPFMHKGSVMGLVRGRNISREFAQDHVEGQRLVTALLEVARTAPPERREHLLGLAKGWIEQDTFLPFTAPKTVHHGDNPSYPVDILGLALDLLASDVPASSGPVGHWTFTAGDRVVHRRPGWTFGIAMHSPRIRNYEVVSNENVRGWYTAHGMTYLYDDDLAQYDDGYWATVDHYRLAGTTVPVGPRADGSYSRRHNPNAWVGGAGLDDVGVAGMHLASVGSSLTARKSWFMFDDEVVAVGSDIDATGGTAVETVVENRKLAEAGQLVVDRRVVGSGRADLDGARWAHLEGVGGYVFAEGTALRSQRESRTGSWSLVRPRSSAEPLTRDYQTLWIDHGTDPVDAGYSYVLLPGASHGATRAYSQCPHAAVLAASPQVHAVRERRLGVEAATVWADGGASAGTITTDAPAAVVVRRSPDGTLEVGVSDPTQQRAGVITVVLDRPTAEVVRADDGVTVTEVGDRVVLQVDVTGSKGATRTAVLGGSAPLPGDSGCPRAAVGRGR